MSVKLFIKKTITFFLSLLSKEDLIEFWVIKRNESKILPSISNFYSGFISSTIKIIDVGANVGNYSKVFTDFGANVIGVEPQQYCQNILIKRFKGVSSFKLISSACGTKISNEKIHKSNSHTIASMNKNWIESVKKSNRFKGEDWNNTETISVTTLDIIIKNNFVPDYIKIDVETYETEVIQGLTKGVKYLSFEYSTRKIITIC